MDIANRIGALLLGLAGPIVLPIIVAALFLWVVSRRGNKVVVAAPARRAAALVLIAAAAPTALALLDLALRHTIGRDNRPDFLAVTDAAFPTLWPLVIVAIMLAVALAIRRPVQVDIPVPPTARRTWRSFAPRGGIIAACALAGVVVIIALASAAQSLWVDGMSVLRTADGSLAGYPGWGTAITITATVIVVMLLGMGLLARDAARPFAHPGAQEAETERRRRSGTAVTALVGAALALVLASLIRSVGHAGAGIVGSDDVTISWAPFSPVLVWGGSAIALLALALLWVMVLARPAAHRAEHMRAVPA